MTKMLMIIHLGPSVTARYRDGVKQAFPDLDVNIVANKSEVDPYIEEAEALFCFPPQIDDDVLKKAKKLKWIQTLGTGVDGLADKPSFRPGTIISAVRGIHGPPVSEGAMALMLGVSRDIPRAVRARDFGKWDRWPSRLLDRKAVGIYGVGSIAETLGRICKGFNMKVVGLSSRKAVEHFDEMRPKDDLPAVVGDLDYLVVLAPLTQESAGSVNADVFKAMKNSAFLINVARGGLVDEEALIEALNDDEIAGAGLDVFAKEPLPEGHLLWTHPKVMMTAHSSGMFDQYPERALPILTTNIRHFLAGETDKMLNVEKI